MILVTMTINSTAYRISIGDLALEHFWQGYILGVTPIKYTIRNPAGGYVEPTFGGFSLSPDLFAGDWPPPKKCAVTVQITDTDEAAAVTVFTGNVYRNGIGASEIKYDFYGDEFTAALSDETMIDDDLDTIFTTYCGASYLNKTLVDTYKRTAVPAVYAKFPAGTLVIDMLDSLSRAVNHLFYISGSSLYLVDMKKDNGTDLDIGAKDPFSAAYFDEPLIKSFISTAAKTYSVAGSTPGVGQVYSSDAAAFVEHLYGRVGDGGANSDYSYLIHDSMLPYENAGGVASKKYYQMSIKARKISGTGTFYAGFAGVAADRTTFVNISGANSFGTQHYFVENADALSAAWKTTIGFAAGWASTGVAAESPNVSNPAEMHTNVAYFRPLIAFNVSAAGEMDIDFVAVDEVDSSGNLLAHLFRDDFEEGFSGSWINYNPSTGVIRETKTAEDESETNVEAALADLKAIIESPRAALTFPLITSRIPKHGQAVNWTDERIGPDDISLDGTIRVRNITLDFMSEEITVEGEGSIA